MVGRDMVGNVKVGSVKIGCDKIGCAKVGNASERTLAVDADAQQGSARCEARIGKTLT